MVKLQQNKEFPEVATDGIDREPPQSNTASCETMTKDISHLYPCSRCGNVRPLTHRVRSDLVDQVVCEPCAAEVPLLIPGVGELTVERIRPSEKIFNLRLERDL